MIEVSEPSKIGQRARSSARYQIHLCTSNPPLKSSFEYSILLDAPRNPFREEYRGKGHSCDGLGEVVCTGRVSFSPVFPQSVIGKNVLQAWKHYAFCLQGVFSLRWAKCRFKLTCFTALQVTLRVRLENPNTSVAMDATVCQVG